MPYESPQAKRYGLPRPPTQGLNFSDFLGKGPEPCRPSGVELVGGLGSFALSQALTPRGVPSGGPREKPVPFQTPHGGATACRGRHTRG